MFGQLGLVSSCSRWAAAAAPIVVAALCTVQTANADVVGYDNVTGITLLNVPAGGGTTARSSGTGGERQGAQREEEFQTVAAGRHGQAP